MTAQKNFKGFTLVELLIVIALLGILAAAVLAAINPLEQANRASDARMRSDASQLLAAVDRYFVAQDEFPWITETPTLTPDSNLTFTSASDATVGVVGTGGSAGYLITANELKTEFTKRSFADTTKCLANSTGGDTDCLYVGKDTGASSSVYACWLPKSNSERKKTDILKNLAFSNGSPTDCAITPNWTSTYCYECLPQ